jgi:LysR family transcriptional regulator, carnitine catabolism transcriptional activator
MECTSRQLRAVLLVAQHRSFTRAAERLFITPSGLSVLVRELENQLGFRLFDRTTRLVEPTAEGTQFLPVVREHLDRLDEAVARIGHEAQSARQSLTIGAPPLFAANVLPHAIREFEQKQPRLRVRLFDGSLTAIYEKVATGELDLAIGHLAPSPSLRRTPFFRFSLGVVRPDGASERHRAGVAWSALKGARLICLSAPSPLQRLVDKQLARAGVAPRDALTVNSLDTQIAMVEAGHGIAVVPSYGLPACRNRRVVMTRLINPIVTLDFHQIQRRGRRLPPEADEFTAYLQQYIARWAGAAGIL